MIPRLRRPIIVVVSAALILLIVIGVISPFLEPSSWEEVRIATGKPGGTYNDLGKELAWVIGELPGNPVQKVSPLETQGSVQNLELLLNSEVDLAFALEPAIAKVTREDRTRLRALASLYTDIVQLVVRKDADITRIMDLTGKRVYAGVEGSGTKIIVEKILTAFQVSDFEGKEADSLTRVADMLITGELHAAFFVSGTTATAVKNALQSGLCTLLDLSESPISAALPDFETVDIPPMTYVNQPALVHTFGVETLLVCRNDLDDELVFLIENALFDHVDKLIRRQDIELESILDDDRLPEGIILHPEAARFKDIEQDNLLIATGTVNGKYWYIGEAIQTVLEQRGIKSRVIRTDGSVDNARLLIERRTLAIMQYDIALASHIGNAQRVFKTGLPGDLHIPPVKRMRRIARLHDELLHIIIRREKLSPDMNERQATLDVLRNQDDLRVCLGPENSGTRVLAHTLLANASIKPTTITSLPIPDMVERIIANEIDVGFFVGYVPSEALKAILNDDTVRLLSLEKKNIATLVGQVFQTDTIDAEKYRCQLAGEPAVDTLMTNAVLVTTADIPFDVEKITKVIFEAADLIGVDKETMAKNLAIPLHQDAMAYYREVNFPGYLQPPSPFDLLGDARRSVMVFLNDLFITLGFSTVTADTLATSIAFVVFIVLSVLVNFAMKYLILEGLVQHVKRSETRWDDILLDRSVLNRSAYLVSALIIYVIAIFIFEGREQWTDVITGATLIYIVVVGFLIVNALLNVFSNLYHTFEVSKDMSVTGVIQMIRIVAGLTAAILVASIILDATPFYVLSGLGAMTAVFLLIFKDTILGFLAGIQLAANKMVAPGDWISMPRYNADGDVIAVTLTTVKVQNFDKTIITIPTSALISESFQNWRGMKESGGRRIKRSINLDINTIRFCTEDMLEWYAAIQSLSDYLDRTQQDMAMWNAAHQIDESNPADRRRFTNIGTFRAYVIAYLQKHPRINQNMTFLVRQLDPTEHGVPIELCVFCEDDDWATYEAVQADIFDHILAVVPEFDLKVFQAPAGSDFSKLAANES